MTISPREKQVLVAIAEGYTAKEIATQLYVSEHTIITHKKRLLHKMKAQNSPALVKRGFDMGVLKPSNPVMNIMMNAAVKSQD